MARWPWVNLIVVFLLVVACGVMAFLLVDSDDRPDFAEPTEVSDLKLIPVCLPAMLLIRWSPFKYQEGATVVVAVYFIIIITGVVVVIIFIVVVVVIVTTTTTTTIFLSFKRWQYSPVSSILILFS